ncbi:P-loop containing nucleoside triphosphate hydrolase protein [Aspergillus bertholletiae]|uniref:P-loop containing nucleoside triphosphate hydrolase protein n=1 Tax=Aspergillus bertholletiae TaxID=1226010 RepID=A0A5N7B8I4_9EURO|nr:P-loop containing nucleoside triphosphate hydrolase protein [Aspergillus bertholletiae]
METNFAIEGIPRNDEVKLQVLQSIDACGLSRPKGVSVKDCIGLTGAEEPEAAFTPAPAPTPELEPEPEPEQSEVSENSAGDTPEDMQVSLCKIDDVYDKKLEKRMFLPYDPLRGAVEQDTNLPSDEYSKWVVVLRRVFCRYDQSLSEVCIDIKSPLVFSVLHKALRDMRATLDVEPSLPWPNDEIFRWRNRIRKIAQDKGELCVEHVNVLLRLVEEQYAPAISDIEHMFPKGTTTFNILREAFFPKDIIVDDIADTPRAYRVTKAEYRVDTYGKRYLHIKAVYIDYDGHTFGARKTEFTIWEFPGIQYFSDLDVFPLKYHPNHPHLVADLMARGQQFVALKGQHFKAHRDVSRNKLRRVMVDTAAIRRLGSCSIKVCDIKHELVDGQLTEEHLLLCTDTVPAFSFEDKKFLTANIGDLEDITFNQEVFRQLVLPDPTKEIVRVMVQSHVNGVEFDNLTKGKGKGLIMLLHGPPGVGKTMTAEAVAEYSQRPLYTITSGELGTTSGDLEDNLNRALEIAKAFRAVLLLDEADVFMEERSTKNIAHNALVAIFLRLLEYYQGILVLTTNRVKNIDDAFHSRVHMSLQYPNLSVAAREKIWRNFAVHIGGLRLSDEEYNQLAQRELNGRQIKNIFGLCKALAVDKGKDISFDLVMMVLDVMEFQAPRLGTI